MKYMVNITAMLSLSLYEYILLIKIRIVFNFRMDYNDALIDVSRSHNREKYTYVCGDYDK